MKIKFIKVGRGKKTWTAEVAGFDQAYMEEAVHRSGALSSRNISFSDTDGNDEGTIFAGLHSVGTFKIIED